MKENLLEKIKILREITGVSIIDCKKALIKTDLDIDKSIFELRKSGALKSVVLENRDALEGQVFMELSSDFKTGVLIEFNCETDFVSKSIEFKEMIKKIANYSLINEISSKDALEKVFFNEILDLRNKYSEKICIGKFAYIKTDNSFIAGYIHGGFNNIGRIGVMLNYSNIEYSTAYNISLHIAAMNPVFISRELIHPDILSSESDIIKKSISNDVFKNQDIFDKILKGKFEKYFSDVVLLDQFYIKDGKIKIKDLLNSNSLILGFFRFEVGK